MTKNNLPKCLAWLLKQDLRHSSLNHFGLIQDQSTIVGEVEEVATEGVAEIGMARLQMAPQSATKPRLLTYKPVSGIPTPVPSGSPQDLNRSLATNSSLRPQQTPNTKPAQPKTPRPYDDDSIFDIEDFDNLLENITHANTSTPVASSNMLTISADGNLKLFAENGASPRSRKRKSDEFLEDCGSPSAISQHNCPNSAIKRRPRAYSGIAGDGYHVGKNSPSGYGSYGSRYAQESSKTDLEFSLFQETDELYEVPKTPRREKGSLIKQSPKTLPLEQSSSKLTTVAQAVGTHISGVESEDNQGDCVIESPNSARPASHQQTDILSLQRSGSRRSYDAPAQIRASADSVPALPRIETPDTPMLPQHNPIVKVIKSSGNTIAASSPQSSGSALSRTNKLSKEEREALHTFLSVPIHRCQELLTQLRSSREKVTQEMVDQLYEDDLASPELREELRSIKGRISALEEIGNRRDRYQAMRQRTETLKAELAVATANAYDIDTDDKCAAVRSRMRRSKPEVEAEESALFSLLKQVNWLDDDGLQSMLQTSNLHNPETRRSILVASTQNVRRDFYAEAGPSETTLPNIVHSSGHPVAQTPPFSHLDRTKAATNDQKAWQAARMATATFSRNMGSPVAGILIDDDFDDAFGDEEDMMNVFQGFEDGQHEINQYSKIDSKPRDALSTMSNNIRRAAPSSSIKSAIAPLRQYSWSQDVLQTLHQRFHLQGFRHNQLEAINATLSGKDAFVLMPTGGGKSLCYQLPSIVNSGQTHGVTVVVSPLLSLMQDQVDHLQKLKVKAFLINGESTREHKNHVYQSLRAPEPEHHVQLLYVTPELLGKSQAMIEKLVDLCKRKKLARLVIDEAHCVSQWGHDFRPDYKALGEIRMQFEGVPVMALTATATENVKVDVIHSLRMDGCEVFTQSFNRPNLFYEIRTKLRGPQLLQSLADTINTSHSGESGIVYCLSRKTCETVAKQLSVHHGISATHYHAGMDADARIGIQKKWQAGQYNVIVATIAFGMGIDKPDVRFVIHHTLPKSLEGYYQETGRAGRDGEPSKCYLYYGHGDTVSLKRMIDDNKDASWQQKERQKQMLRNVVQFCNNRSDCRRVQVLAYFNEHFRKEQCQATCDNCQSDSVFQSMDFSEHGKNIIRLVEQVQASEVSLLHCVDVYRGTSSKKIADMGHRELQQYGQGSDLDRGEVERMFYGLISEDAIEETSKVNGAGFASSFVSLGCRSKEFLRGQKQFRILVRTSPRPKLKSKGTSKANRKRQRGSGTAMIEEFPASTNVSSPIDRRRPGKRRGGNPHDRPNVSECEESDDNVVDLAAIRRAGRPPPSRSKPIGPPITIDEKIARLDDAHRHILNDFIDNVNRELRVITMQKGLRQRPLSDTVLREIGIAFPVTIASLHDLPGLTDDKITLYGSLLMKHVNNARRDYEAIVSAQEVTTFTNQQSRVVEISDDDDLEENFISDDESDYFDLEPESRPSLTDPSRTGSHRKQGKVYDALPMTKLTGEKLHHLIDHLRLDRRRSRVVKEYRNLVKLRQAHFGRQKALEEERLPSTRTPGEWQRGNNT